jgi:cytochrome b6-f complex iron-sulfur subunit
MNKLPPGKTRRGFLSQALLAWTGIIVVPVFYGIIRYLTPPPGHDTMTSVISAGKISDIPGYLQGAKLIKFNRKAVFVYKNGQNQIKALSAVCTHLGCVVEYHSGEQRFKCNCHGSVFDVDGKNMSGPAPLPLTPYRVEIRDDNVVLYQG